MGQAAVDLPDPLQAAPEPPNTSTDELLSQLAGEEIDRLLAEVEGDVRDLRDPRAAGSPIDISPPVRPELENAQEPGAAAAAPGVVDEPAAPSSKDETVTAELDALFSAAVEKDKADEEAAAAAAAIAAETSAAERAGLSTVAGTAPAAEPVPEDDNAPLPLYLRPLEWLNAPLKIFPPAVRDLIGKVAIVTLINAVAILAYVLIVRRG